MNILFVCSDNTYQSPIATAITESILTESSIDLVVDSAGLFCANGAKVKGKVIELMQSMGFDLSTHRSKPLSVGLMNEADLVIAMTETDKRVLLRQFIFMANKIKTICEWAGTENAEECMASIDRVAKKDIETLQKLIAKAITNMKPLR